MNDLDNEIGASLERFLENGGRTPVGYVCDMEKPGPEPIMVIRKDGKEIPQ